MTYFASIKFISVWYSHKNLIFKNTSVVFKLPRQNSFNRSSAASNKLAKTECIGTVNCIYMYIYLFKGGCHQCPAECRFRIAGFFRFFLLFCFCSPSTVESTCVSIKTWIVTANRSVAAVLYPNSVQRKENEKKKTTKTPLPFVDSVAARLRPWSLGVLGVYALCVPCVPYVCCAYVSVFIQLYVCAQTAKCLCEQAYVCVYVIYIHLATGFLHSAGHSFARACVGVCVRGERILLVGLLCASNQNIVLR